MTNQLTTAEMRAAIEAQRQGPPTLGCGHSQNLARGGCRVCGLVGMASYNVDPDDDRTQERLKARHEYRNREAEANAWEFLFTITHSEVCAMVGEALRGREAWNALRHVFDDVVLNEALHAYVCGVAGTDEEMALIEVIETRRSPRAIVEEGPEPGSEAAALMLSDTRLRLAVRFDSLQGDNPWNWPPEAHVRADLAMEAARASRDVPAFTEVDRYDPETGAPRNPRYLEPSVEWLMRNVKGAPRGDGPLTTGTVAVLGRSTVA